MPDVVEIYEKAYRYYCESCERSNEESYPFETYFNHVPIWEAREFVEYNERNERLI